MRHDEHEVEQGADTEENQHDAHNHAHTRSPAPGSPLGQRLTGVAFPVEGERGAWRTDQVRWRLIIPESM